MEGSLTEAYFEENSRIVEPSLIVNGGAPGDVARDSVDSDSTQLEVATQLSGSGAILSNDSND